MVLINFAHPITDAQRAQIEALTGQTIVQIIDVRTQFDHVQPFAEQTRAAIDGIGLDATQWQSTPLMVNLPSFSPIAAIVLAELHGRMGYFPAVLRLRPLAGTTPPAYEMGEIVNLQTVRDDARQRRLD
jgi:hypothetical protein